MNLRKIYIAKMYLSGFIIKRRLLNERPADLGYYIGFKITQSYYQNSKYKKEAINEILNVKDFKSFLEKSKYEEKFN
ncbi:gliding motility protein GldB-related protein [Pedobacter sp. NJ-S-72]